MQQPEQEFTVVTRKIIKTTKVNATFRVIDELLQARDPLILNCGMPYIRKQSAKSEAVLFKIPDDPEHRHFIAAGFIFKERHLRVDKLFSSSNSMQGKSGYAAAHYTENYVKPNTAETITIHVYYCDTVSYVQVRKQNGQENIEWLDEAAIEKTVKANSLAAFAFYKKLESEKNSRYLAVLEVADKAEKNIQRLSRTMSTADQILNYLRAIDEFCKLISKVNFYNDFEIDCRDVFSQKVKAALQSKLELLQKKPEKTLEATASVISVAEDSATEPVKNSPPKSVQPRTEAPQIAVDDEFVAIKKLSAELAKCLKPLTAQSLISAMKIAADLQLQLLLYTPPRRTKKDAKKKQLKAIEKQLDEIPTVLSFSEKAVLAGDVNAIQELYPVMALTDQFWICDLAVSTLLKSPSKGAEVLDEKLRSILEFFHTTSPRYSLFIKLQAGCIKENTSKQSGFSTLFNAIFTGNKLLFDLLIRHGIEVDHLGYHKCNVFYSVLKATAFFTTDSYYLQRLLEVNATIDIPMSAIAIDPKQAKPLSKKINMSFFDAGLKSKDPTEIKAFNEIQTVAFESDLSAACAMPNFSYIPLLLNGSSFFSQVYALARVVHLDSFMHRFVYNSTHPGIFILKNLEETNAFHASISKPNKLVLHVSMLVYPSKAFNLANLSYVKMLADSVHNYCQNHPEAIPNIIAQLEKMIKENSAVRKEIVYFACQILYTEMITDDHNLSFEENYQQNTDLRQKLMQSLCQYAHCVKQKQHLQCAIAAYKHCVHMAQYNSFLQSTPIFQYADERIPENERPEMLSFEPIVIDEDNESYSGINPLRF